MTSLDETVHISAGRKAELEQELTERKETLRPEILEKLQYAKSLGDLSENAEYHAAREAQGKNESRIKQLEYILKHAEIVEKKSDGTIGLSSEIRLKKSDDSEVSYTLVGPEEADMSKKLLSHTSPLGAALMGKSAGDTAEIETPKGTSSYTIISIN